MVSMGQTLNDNFGLEWGDELKSINIELSSFPFRRTNTNVNDSPLFLTDPNESISQNDEALGLEFASSVPFVSTPTSVNLPALKTECGFLENSSDSYNLSGGFDNSGFRLQGTGSYERTFSSSSNSSSTSFISEGSFNSILKSAQPDSRFRDSGIGLASSPYRGDNFGGNDGWNPRNGSGIEESFGYSSNAFQDQFDSSEVESHRRWNFLDQSSPPLTPSRPLRQGMDEGNRFTSPLRPPPPGLSNCMRNEFSDYDPYNRFDSSPKETSTLFANSIWESPSTFNQSRQLASGLTAKEAIQCIELFKGIREQAKNNKDYAKLTQVTALIQILQQHLEQHLLLELGVQSSPKNFPEPRTPTETAVDRSVKVHQIAGIADAKLIWNDTLPVRVHRNPTYSCKVFLGGVPWDITEGALINAFRHFGNVKIEWPGKDGYPPQPKGYAYAIFEHERQVRHLIQNCTHDYSTNKAGNFYFRISSKRIRYKDVQVIPWALSDSNYAKYQATKLDGKKTIFVGALHGMMNAEGLAKVMDDLFKGVVHAGIDTDKYKYPIGSGRVSFDNYKSYEKAITAAFVEIRAPKFKKTVQVDPYLEDATCSVCLLQQAPYFCREWVCFRYFCRTCYEMTHTGEAFAHHRPLQRNASKPLGVVTVTPANFSSDSRRDGQQAVSFSNGRSCGYNSCGLVGSGSQQNYGLSNVGSSMASLNSNGYGGWHGGSFSASKGFQRRIESANNNTRFSQMR